jgi:hypothetical protein
MILLLVKNKRMDEKRMFQILNAPSSSEPEHRENNYGMKNL